MYGENYIDRVKEAFNFRDNPLEATARTVVPAFVASLALTAAANSGMESPLPPVVQKDPTPPVERKVTIPGRQYFVPGKLTKTTEAIPSVNLTFSQAYAPEFEAFPLEGTQTRKLDKFAKDVETEYNEGPEKIEIKIKGLSSDESGVEPTSGEDANLGRKSADNEDLAVQRATLVEGYLKDKVLKIADNEYFNTEFSLVSTGEEQVLIKKEIKAVDHIAEKHDVSRSELIDDYNGEKTIKLNNLDARILNKHFDEERGAVVTATATYETTPFVDKCDEVVRVEKEPDQQLKEITPGKDGWGLYFFPLVIPPLPRRRRRLPRLRMPEFDMSRFSTRKTPKEPEAITEQPYMPRLRARDLLGFNVKKPTIPPLPTVKMPAINKPTVPEGLKKAARVGLVIAILPFPWAGKSQPRESYRHANDCTTETYKPGKSFKFFGNLASIAAYRKIKGRDDWNKQLDLGDPQYTPNEATKTTKEFDRIIVDKNGKVIKTQFVESLKDKKYSYR